MTIRLCIASLFLLFATVASAGSKGEINAEVKEAIANFHKQTSAGH